MTTPHRTLLRQSLDALSGLVLNPESHPLIAALREALAAPEPEPAAYLVEGWHDGKLIAHISHLTLEDAKASAAVFSQHYTTTKLVPLYAAPPAAPAPAQPVPLTQDQIADCTRTAHRACDAKGPMTRWSTEFARAIEAAHGITGGSK